MKKELPINQRRMIPADQVANYLGVGVQKARVLCREIGCEVRIGGRLLYDRPMIDAWIESQKRKDAV